MKSQKQSSLSELQKIDQEIISIESVVNTFDSKLEEVGEPIYDLEKEVQALKARLQEVRLEENRLELSIEDRRVRSAKLEERMNEVRNVREEAAVQAELDMVQRTLENYEQEALSQLDQIRRLEEALDEHEQAYEQALTEIEPRRLELINEQENAKVQLKALKDKRDDFADSINPEERRVYESIMSGSRDVAVSEITQDGACGNCFCVIPLQVQNEIRSSIKMIRCEGCGVILTPESGEGIAKAQEENARIEAALRFAADSTGDEDLVGLVQEEVIVGDEADEGIVLEEDHISGDADNAESDVEIKNLFNKDSDHLVDGVIDSIPDAEGREEDITEGSV